jgi:hypothetical protein
LPHAVHTNRDDPRHVVGARRSVYNVKTAIFQLMPSLKFESNGGSSYDNECSYCDAVSFDDARLHELAPILIIALPAQILH